MQSGAGSEPGGRGTALASLAAVASVLAATSCCLPVLPFFLAASLAGSSAFLWAARPYLLAASVLLIAYGFYQAARARKCQNRPSAVRSILLWASTAFVLLSILFPQVMASAAGGGQAPSGQPALFQLTARNVAGIQHEFNAAKNDVRVLLLLSPT